MGLYFVLYFVSMYPQAFRNILKADRGYPLSVSGINILFQLQAMLKPPQQQQQTTASTNAASKSNTYSLLFLFMATCVTQEALASPKTILPPHAHKKQSATSVPGILYRRPHYVFEDVFVLFNLLLDKIWVERNASYMDYSNIIKETRQRFEQALSQRPTCLKMLAMQLQLQDVFK